VSEGEQAVPAISRLSGEFLDRAVEERYRDHVNGENGQHVRRIMLVASLLYLAFTFGDVLNVGLGEVYHERLMARVGVFLLGVAIVAIMREWPARNLRYPMVFLFEMALVGSNILVVTSLEVQTVGQLVAMFVMIWAIYLIIPNPFRWVLAAGLLASTAYAGSIVLLDKQLPIGAGPLVTLLFAINLLAAFTARRLNWLRRSEYGKSLGVREAEGNVRRLFEASPLPLVLTRLSDGTVRQVNQAAAAFFKVDPQEALGRRAQDFHADPHQRDELVALIKAQGQISNYEIDLLTADGVRKRVLLAGALIQYFGESCLMIGITDITARKEFEEALHRLATTDPLTGLYNRRHFFELVEKEVTRTRRYSRALSFLMIDIDHFKSINDRFGHEAGDEALKRMSEMLRQVVREHDIVARFGGEEFAVALPETGLQAAVEVAERVRLATAGWSGPAAFTVSIGVTQMLPVEEMLDDALRRADKALYRAKNTGRDRVEVLAVAVAAQVGQ